MIKYKIFEEKGFYVVKKRVFFFFWKTVFPAFARSNSIGAYEKFRHAREAGYYLGSNVFVTAKDAFNYAKNLMRIDVLIEKLYRR